MLRVSQDTPLTVENIKRWIEEFQSKMLPGILDNKSYYLNSRKDALPFAKKIVTIASAATLGNGIDIRWDGDETVSEQEKTSLDRVLATFRRQSIGAEDLGVITDGCTYGVAYELGYMSSDEYPVPKVKDLPPTNAFVVFDDTVEENGLYGIYYSEDDDGMDVSAYDAETCTSFRLDAESGAGETTTIPHHMGRMPLTMYFNNRERQGDFEQVKPTMLARNKIHALAMDDAETIANNIILLIGGELNGDTEEEKKRTIRTVSKTKVLELGEGATASILTKPESFAMIAVFGKDVENKIYDLSMVCNFTSEEFAGNTTGVALRLKLFPFKRLVKNKDYYIEKLYRRRIKMYLHGLAQTDSDIEEFDVSKLNISVKRTWEENLLELAQVIGQLAPTGLFSDKFLIERMPDGEYEVELNQKQKEQKEDVGTTASKVNADNPAIGDYAALLRNLGGAS